MSIEKREDVLQFGFFFLVQKALLFLRTSSYLAG